VLGRFLTCPFLAVIAELPSGARVLDVGAGHGVLARLAAEAGAGSIVALEPDIRKLPAGLRHPAIHWVSGYDASITGAFDAVVLCDVLYRVPMAERDALLTRLTERLKPGGRLILKEIDPANRLKHAWNVAQETFAIHVLRITIGSGQTYEDRSAIRSRLERLGLNAITTTAIGRGYPHAHVLYTARRPDA
jgi:2-polyprenyl-3-methyl-5-hydroxy-6-metoxy-1,4-benzoquinol methylase